MYLPRIFTASAAASIALMGAALAGEHLQAHRARTCTPDGVCVPSRQTYGYHPTQWRRWPGAEFEAATKVEKPTKAKEPLPPPVKPADEDTYPRGDQPADLFKDDLPLPGDDSDTMPAPPQDSAPLDTEPALPGEVQKNLPQPPLDTDLRNLLNDDDGSKTSRPKSSPVAEPEEDTTPQLPGDEDDPFKDELPGDPNNESGRRTKQAAPTNSRADGMRWRKAPHLAAEAAQNEDVSPEPRRLQSAVDGELTAPRSTTAMMHNPLRKATAAAKPKPRQTQNVVPTADWSAQADDSSSANLWRSNPLRTR